VGWNGSAWVEISSKVDINSILGEISSLESGSITSLPDFNLANYSVFTFGKKEAQPPPIQFAIYVSRNTLFVDSSQPFNSLLVYTIWGQKLFEKKIAAGDLLTFGKDNKHILIELPFMSEPPNLNACLFELQIAGYIPVLAHPERYLYYANDREKYLSLKERGILLQLNILSCVGYYSKPVAEAAEYLVLNNLIDLVGSDTHHKRHMQILPDAIQHKIYRKVCEAELLNNYL
jgi:hypothetical protein